MPRLPTPGSDDNTWGTLLNDYLTQAHNPDGTIKDIGVVGAKADDNSVIHNTTDETVAGTKTFTTPPAITAAPTAGTDATNKTYVDSTVSAGTPDATTTSKGKVQLAGDLSGTAAAPTVAAGAIDNSKVSASAAIAETKLNLASDAAAGTASRRTLGYGTNQAAQGSAVDARLTSVESSDAGKLAKASNLSDLTNVSTARTNLGLGTAAQQALDTDGTLSANSDVKIASQKATKTYVDAHSSAVTKPYLGLTTARGIAAIGFQTVKPTGTGAFYATFPNAVRDLRVMYTNFALQGELPGPNALTIAAAVVIGSTVYPFTFNGRARATLDPGGSITSDPLSLEISAGAGLFFRTYHDAGAGGSTPYNHLSNGGSEGWTDTTDLTVVGSGALGTTQVNGFAPTMILGSTTTNTPTIALIGDSIMYGSGDVTDPYDANAYGFATRALNRLYPAVKIAAPGEAVNTIVAAGGSRFRYAILQSARCKYAITEYGTNDLGSRSAAQVLTDIITLANSLVARNIAVYQTTISPRTTSTDSWATTTNQSPAISSAQEAQRVILNDALRAVPAPLTGVIDTADQWESARNSGKWKVNGTANYFTADGIHPSPAGHAAGATAINTALFV